MPELTIRIKKKTDGAAALSCRRADGSVTWQRQEGQLGRFLPQHDLTHYVVESTLGFDHAFYGLIASGWDISDFAGPGANKRIGVQEHLSEVLVGFFDLERRTGEPLGADEFNAKVDDYFADKKLDRPDFRITDEQIAAVRQRRTELFAKWDKVPAGETIELVFQ
jgi:hypothetical protein